MLFTRQTTTGNGLVTGDYPGVGVIVGLDPILYRRFTLDIVVNFVSRLGPLHKAVVEGTVLKLIIKCRKFPHQRELALALVAGGFHIGGHLG